MRSPFFLCCAVLNNNISATQTHHSIPMVHRTSTTEAVLIATYYPIVCIRTEALIKAMARTRFISTSLSAWWGFWLTRRM